MANAKSKRLPRPRDPVQLAKLVGDIATGQVKDEQPTMDDVRRVMSMLGKLGGPKGGRARAEALSSRRKSEIAKRAALARWKGGK
jgi:hypothetical protein